MEKDRAELFNQRRHEDVLRLVHEFAGNYKIDTFTYFKQAIDSGVLQNDYHFIIANVPGTRDEKRLKEIGEMGLGVEACYDESLDHIRFIRNRVQENHSTTKIILFTGAVPKVLDKIAEEDLSDYLINPSWVKMGPDGNDPMDETIQQFKNILLNPNLNTKTLIEEFINRINVDHSLNDHECYLVFHMILNQINLTTNNVQDIQLIDQGYTSKKGFTFKDLFIKVDSTDRLTKEFDIYSTDFGLFNYFRPSTIEFISSENIAILALENLHNYDPAFLKANRIFNLNLKKESDYYSLFLMSLFHKEANLHKDKFDIVEYEGIYKLRHYDEGYVPIENVSDEGYKRFRETQINIQEVKSIVEDYLQRQKEEADTIIHGDWKKENLVNGYLVDYAMVGRGYEVDELAYFLTDKDLNCNLKTYHKNIDKYIEIRSLHDSYFKQQVREGYNLHELADSAFLSQLVLRHAVMNKRDMMNPEKYAQRKYYQYMIGQVLKEGEFI